MVSTVKPTSRRKSIGQHKKHSQKQPNAEAKRAALKVQQAQERLIINRKRGPVGIQVGPGW